MKKLILASAIVAMSAQLSPVYSMGDLKFNHAPQPSNKRGKFKRRNKGRK
tara:strand:+ start:285 stop:434 length:150 start_codon:yes stop_codon:yes gene_type:complete